MPPNARTKGSVTLVLLLIATLIGVMFAGAYIWRADHPAKKPDDSLASGAGGKAANSSYLTIASWGVKLPLPADLQGDVYFRVYTNAQGEQGVQFASKRLDNLVGDGYCTFRAQADGKVYGTGVSASLARIDPKHPGQETVAYFQSQHTFVKTIGAYDYYRDKPLKDPPITCTSERHPQFNAVEQTVSQELTTAFSKMIAAN